MAKRTCSIEGCERIHYARGWCSRHYKRWLLDVSADHSRITAEERFWAKVDRRGDDECWLWTASLNNRGYSQFLHNRLLRLGHRFSFELLVGPIPDGLQLDHLCRVRHCVNPAHLEIVTPRENCLRGKSIAAENARKTHCPRGHPYSGDNLIIRQNGRSCRICVNTKQNEAYHARKTQGPTNVG